MSYSNIVNSVGLLLDILGVILVWRYGLPESINREGQNLIAMEGYDSAEIAKAANYDRLSQVGLGLIVIGFLIQLASNFINV